MDPAGHHPITDPDLATFIGGDVADDVIQQTIGGGIFLIGAGAVGRGYSNFIKVKGGIAVDIGKVMDMWAGVRSSQKWGELYKDYVKANGLTYELTKEGEKYERHF